MSIQGAAYLYISTPFWARKVETPGFMQLLENLVFVEFPRFLFRDVSIVESLRIAPTYYFAASKLSMDRLAVTPLFEDSSVF